MKKYFQFFIVLLICLIPFNSFSQDGDWIKIVESGGGTQYVVKKSSIVRSGNYIKAWLKIYLRGYHRDEFVKVFTDGAEVDKILMWMEYDYNLSLYEFDCSKNISRMLSVYTYDKNGTCIYNNVTDNPVWDPIIPETVFETVFDYICKSKNQQKKIN